MMRRLLCVFSLWPTIASSADWDGENLKRIDEFIQQYKGQGAVAIFDWDNTVIKNDIGDATFFWMLTHDLIHLPTDWKKISSLLTAQAVDALERTCQSKNISCTDLLLSIYMDGVLPDKQPAWETSFHKDYIEPGYAFAVQLMSGHSPDDMRRIAKDAMVWNLRQSIGKRQKIGSKEYTAYIRIYEPMKRFIKKLQKNGFDVWVVSASSQYLVETFAQKVGIAKDRVIGVRSVVDHNGKITSFFEGCGLEPDGNQTLITYRQGKRCWINKVIFQEKNARAQLETPSPILFGAGDSDTDFFFLKDATELRVVLNRNKREVMCHASQNKDGKWLINPMFIDPKPHKKDGYSCTTYGILDQPDTVH